MRQSNLTQRLVAKGCEPTTASAPTPVAITLTEAIQIAKAGYAAWATKPHNKRWYRRIDGTPVPNDLTVTIAEAFYEALGAMQQETAA